jgi:threonine synthase
MNLFYKSTRNSDTKVTASQAILKGLAEDGGLFVPTQIPKLPVSLGELKEMSYQETAYTVMKEFLTDFTEEELKDCIAKAYDSKFDTEEIAPLAKVENAYYLELYHGATIAFKDMALSILPHLLTTSAKKNGVKNDIVILTATSGDTGKAALAGFADVDGVKIIVFYPKNGVSRVQELQMVTQKGANTSVVAVHGNFDNAQSGVKSMFEDKELANELDEAGYQFSSANSINIGRLVPQVVVPCRNTVYSASFNV